MVTEKNNHECIVRFLKDNPLRQAGAALENASDQFANPKPAVHMRVAERRAKLKQRENGGDSFAFRQRAQLF